MLNYNIKHIQSYQDMHHEIYSYLQEHNALFFLKWLNIIDHTYGVKIGCLCVRNHHTKIVGVLLYYVSGNSFLGKKIYSAYDGLVVDHDDIAKILCDKIKIVARQVGAILLHLCSDTQQYPFLDDVIVKVKLGINLAISKEELWKSLRDKTRNAIRKGEKTGIQLKQGNHLLADFYKIYSERMQSKQVGFHSQDFFIQLIKQYGNNCTIYIAEHEGIAIASALILNDATSAYYLFSGMISGYEALCPIQSILWHAIESCYEQGIQYFDMGESSVDSGTYKFKIWFGCQPKEVYYYSLPIQSQNDIQLSLHKIATKLNTIVYKIACNLPVSNLKSPLLIKQKLQGKIV